MTPDHLGKLFESFRVSAFRLECLPAYDVTEDAERDAYRLWLAGDRPQAPDREWPKLVASVVAAGKTVQRVRVIHGMTDYIRFELEWGYPSNVAAGEDIRVLELGADDESPALDYWLFDSVVAVRLLYDGTGQFLGVESVDYPNGVSQLCRIRDAVMARAVPFAQYRASLRA